MMPTRSQVLLSLFVGVCALMWGVLGIAETRGALLPQLPRGAAIPIAGLAAGVVLVGIALRRRRKGGPDSKPVPVLAVPRLVALAKASSHGGAALGGAYGGLLLLLLPTWDNPARRDRAVVAGLAVIAALALVAAGLFLERACRVPSPDDDELLPPPAG